MDEEEFDSQMELQAFGTRDAMRRDAELRRRMTLGDALWGRTSDDLQRQLIAPHPKIPSGFDLADFRELLTLSARIGSLDLSDRRNAWLHPLLFPASTVLVNSQRFTVWEARYEIVRRAIEYLENR